MLIIIMMIFFWIKLNSKIVHKCSQVLMYAGKLFLKIFVFMWSQVYQRSTDFAESFLLHWLWKAQCWNCCVSSRQVRPSPKLKSCVLVPSDCRKLRLKQFFRLCAIHCIISRRVHCETMQCNLKNDIFYLYIHTYIYLFFL